VVASIKVSAVKAMKQVFGCTHDSGDSNQLARMMLAMGDNVNPRLIRPVPGCNGMAGKAGPGNASSATTGWFPIFDPGSRGEFPLTQDSNVSSSAAQAITLYTTAICPYCVAAKNFLKSQGLAWQEIRIDMDAQARDAMLARTRRTSVPQIFIGQTHVGGYDELILLHRAGGLTALLADGAP
jgi:glutaredoxin 3